MIIKTDKKNKFQSMFEPKTGFYARTGILDENGKDTGVDPFMASYPELLDIGIMQTCVCSGSCNVDCYQKACEKKGPNMSLENLEKILKQSERKLFQCLEENELVLIKEGNYVKAIAIKDVKIGDIIFCGKNQFAKITEIHKKESEIYDIELTYGKHILATKEHRFPTKDGLKKVEELNTKDVLLNTNKDFNIDSIKVIDILKLIIQVGLDSELYLTDCPGLDTICKKHNIYRNSHKTVRIDRIKNYLNEIDYSNAYISKERSQFKLKTIYNITDSFLILLGHYIGNGSKRSYVISKEQNKMIEAIDNGLKENFSNFKYSKSIVKNTAKIELDSKLLHSLLFDKIFECRTNNNEKQLPNFIFSLSQEQKLAFLKGYFCDGNFKITTIDGNYGNITFNTSSKKLASDICLLLSSMDIDYSVSSEKECQVPFSKTDTRIIGRRKRYRIKISNLLELEKIKQVVEDHKNSEVFYSIINSEHDAKYLRKRKDYEIISIKKIEEKHNVVDINIDSQEHLFITSHGIISHNCALGGAGDVDTHEQFEEVLKLCRKYNIVPNFTTSGILMTKEKAEICKKYCGAVAVSQHTPLRKTIIWKDKKDLTEEEINNPGKNIEYYDTFGEVSDKYLSNNWYLTNEILDVPNFVYKTVYFEDEAAYTYKAIKLLLDAKVKTSIHYVLSKKSIDEAIFRIKNNAFPNGINAVVFLLYKPVGLGKEENVLNVTDPKVKEFFKAVDETKTRFKIGFDSCSCSGIVNFAKNVNLDSIDYCEGARFSAYIDANMNMMPCSFANQDSSWFMSLNEYTIEEVWNSKIFDKFRYSLQNSCISCKNRLACGGGCPLVNQITLCNKKERDFKAGK